MDREFKMKLDAIQRKNKTVKTEHEEEEVKKRDKADRIKTEIPLYFLQIECLKENSVIL